MTYAEAKRLYPGAIISVEQGNFAVLWRNRASDKREQYYFVFREGGEELFRAECFCKLTSPESWKPIYLLENADPTEIMIIPAAVSPKFHTERGIRVGSTVAQLRKAYADLNELTAVRQTVPFSGLDYEFVCFDGHVLNAAKDSIHTMNFYVRPSVGKKFAGSYKDADYTKIISEEATIVAIEPHGGCLLNAIPPG